MLQSSTFVVVGFTSPFLTRPSSEHTPQGRKKTKLNQTLLNGNNICMVCYTDYMRRQL